MNPKQLRLIQQKSKKKYKYSNDQQIKNLSYEANIESSSFDQKIGVTRVKQISMPTPNKIKSKPHFSMDKISIFSDVNSNISSPLTANKIQKYKRVKNKDKQKQIFKLPQIKRSGLQKLHNPQQVKEQLKKQPQKYYQSKVLRALKHKQETYMLNLARQHFSQCVQAIKLGKNIKLNQPKQIKLSKKTPKFKTIFLDLDETLIHCDQTSTNYSVKLNFPIEAGGTISAGIRIRPFCHEFIRDLSTFAEVIIFTASAPSYADVVLDYLDPQKKYFAHRLYRQHCTLQRGFYTKDLRITNRRSQDIAIVDNSAFSFMTQPQFGIPILPFYHFAKDRELLQLLQYLKILVQQPDMRQYIKKTFFWDFYPKIQDDPRKIFMLQYENYKVFTF